MPDWIEIDGARGTGSANIVRTGVALSLLTARPVRVSGIRAEADPIGLRSEHLAWLAAVLQVAPDSELRGADVGSQQIELVPGAVKPGRYRLNVGARGCACTLIQTLALPLASAGGRSELTVAGTTHRVDGPSYEYLSHVWARWLRSMGVHIELSITRPGFYPRGGGQLTASIEPLLQPLQGIVAVETGTMLRVRLTSMQTNDLPRGGERRRASSFNTKLRRRPKLVGAMIEIDRSEGVYPYQGSTGAQLFALSEFTEQVLGAQAVTGRGERPEKVGEALGERMLALIESGAPVDQFGADQLLLPMALADSNSHILVEDLTQRARDEMHAIEQCLGVFFEVEGEKPASIKVTKEGAP